MKIKLLFLTLSVFVLNTVQSQNITITAPETDNFITSLRAPNGTVDHTTLRTHFIIPASELQGIPIGTVIDELGVNLQAAGTGAASGNLQFYLENTTDVVNNKSANWTIATASMTSVYNGPFSIPSAVGPADFPITTAFTYTGGGLYIAYDYLGSVFGTAPAFYWVNTELDSSCMSASTMTTTPSDSVNSVTSSRPEIRFTFVNPFTNNLEVSVIEPELGVSNAYLTDDNDIHVEITNIGTQGVTSAVVTLELIGSVVYTTNQTITALGSNASQIITFTNVPNGDSPGQIIQVTVPTDQQTFNDTLQYFHTISCDSISYTDYGIATSSVGYNTGQGILGVRYDISNNLPVNVTSIDFRVGNNAASPGNTIKGVLLNSTGAIVDSTLPYTILAGDLGQPKSLPLLNGNVNYANQTVFAGIRQTANTSLGYFPVGLQEHINASADKNFSTGVSGGTITYQNGLPPFMVLLTIEPRPIIVYSNFSNQLCAGSPVNIGIFPLVFDTYDIYEGGVLLQSNTSGTFTVNPLITTTYDLFAVKGTCPGPTGSITITVVSEYNISLTEDICTGESFTFNGQILTTTGQYIDTLSSVGGCDSIITLDLDVLMPSSATLNESICDGDFYTFGGSDLTVSGAYVDVIMNSVGCDSTITLNLDVLLDDVSVAQTGATLTVAVAGATYQWLDCDNGNSPIAGATSQSFTPTAAMGITGNYAVEVTLGNCTAISPCSTVDFTGIDDYLDGGLVIFPNPVVDVLSIKSSIENINNYVIFDAAGRQVQSGSINQSEIITINVSELAKGNYVLELSNKSNTFKKSFIK